MEDISKRTDGLVYLLTTTLQSYNLIPNNVSLTEKTLKKYTFEEFLDTIKVWAAIKDYDEEKWYEIFIHIGDPQFKPLFKEVK